MTSLEAIYKVDTASPGATKGYRRKHYDDTVMIKISSPLTKSNELLISLLVRGHISQNVKQYVFQRSKRNLCRSFAGQIIINYTFSNATKY